jgi:hypothetical protein
LVGAVFFDFGVDVEDLAVMHRQIIKSLCEKKTNLDYVADEIWQDFVLLDLLTVVTNLLFHDALLMLESQRL